MTCSKSSLSKRKAMNPSDHEVATRLWDMTVLFGLAGVLALILLLTWMLVHWTGKSDEERCHRCKQYYPQYWHSDDALWTRVAGNYETLCPECFQEMAQDKGVAIEWKCQERSGGG